MKQGRQLRLILDAFILGIVGALSAQAFMFLLRICQSFFLSRLAGYYPPGLPGKAHMEPRGAIWTAIEVNGTEFQFFNTHLSFRAKERQIQAQALLDKEWLSHPDCRGPVILCGDFNAIPFSAVWRRLRRRLPDAQLTLNRHRPQKTLFGRYPLARIDHVFVDSGIEVASIEVPNTELTRVASDHLPLIVDVDIPRS